MKKRWYRWVFITAAAVVLVLGLRSCFANNSDLTDREPVDEIDAELTLKSVTLEQPDEDGTLLWQLKAESVIYTPGNERADLVALEGKFFQDGEVVYTVEADEGEVLQNGDTLFLRGNLVATGTENELTLEGEKLKWQPKQDLLVMGEFDDADNFGALAENTKEVSLSDTIEADTTEAPVSIEDAPVIGFTPQLKTAARLVIVNNREDRVDLTGDVLAQSKESPWLAFDSAALTWFTERDLIEADQVLTVEQYSGEDYERVTDRLVGGRGQVDLASNVVTVEDDVQLDSLTQPLSVNSEQAVWRIDEQLVTMDRAVAIEQPERGVDAIANQASLDLATQTIYLDGNVQANAEKNDAQLNADSVVWNTATQQVEAEGNVRYRQADDPDVSISGARAVGDIETGTLVVEGGESGEVITEIVPN